MSALGDWLALVALALQIEEMTDSALAISALFICLWAPAVVLAGHAGVLVDRVETTRFLVVVSLAQAAVAVGLAFADALAAVLALSALLGVGFALSQAAEFALVPAVCGRDRLQQANGHVETSRYLGCTLGPMAGSVLAAFGGTEVAMLAAALGALAAGGLAVTVLGARATL